MNKKQSREQRNKRVGHAHSPKVRKLEIVRANSLITLTSPVPRSFTSCPLASAKAKSPTHGAYAPIHGQGEAKPKPRLIPADRKRFYDMEDGPRRDTIDKRSGKAKMKAIRKDNPGPGPQPMRRYPDYTGVMNGGITPIHTKRTVFK